jgi:hypothetical protein
MNKICFVAAWFWYAVVAAVLYGAYQIFTRLAAERVRDPWFVSVAQVEIDSVFT